MKKLILLIALVATSFTQVVTAQTEANPTLLSTYYALKDALVAGDASISASKSAELVTAVSTTNTEILPKAIKEKLLTNAGKITASKDIKVQREQFLGLSDQVIALAKKSKLSEEPVYVQYCPMKKGSWLSSDKAIKNPYYGSAMLTCGKVTETLK